MDIMYPGFDIIVCLGRSAGAPRDATVSGGCTEAFPSSGIEQPAWLQRMSLVDTVSGKRARLYESLLFEQTYHAAYEPMRAVRTERHIYIVRYDGRDRLVVPNTDDTLAKEDMIEAGWEQRPRHQEMLYDLYFDPDQQNNLAERSDMEDVKEDLHSQLERWMKATNDPLLGGDVPLPKGVWTTDVDAPSPRTEPFIVGE